MTAAEGLRMAMPRGAGVRSFYSVARLELLRIRLTTVTGRQVKAT
jgi:hypothetical protein